MAGQVHAGHAGLGRFRLALRHGQCRFRIIDGLFRMHQVLAGNRVVQRQRCAARQVALRRGQGQAALFDDGVVLRHAGIALALLAHHVAQARSAWLRARSASMPFRVTVGAPA